MGGFDAALARYRAFLAHDPITPLLRRSLALLVPGNIRVDTVTADDSLRCTTDGTAVTVGGAEYLLRADFDARHWTAALRVLLAREIQHDSSSDRDVCAAFAADAGAYFYAHYALATETGALLGHRILNILEQARTDNILCRRFPGYLPLLRFVCYAQLEAAEPGSALEALLSPLKRVGVPAHELAMMMTIALRFVPTLLEETDKIMKAQQARGADFTTGSIARRLKSVVPILVPLFISAFRRADELAMAMEARCYHGGEGRTQMKQLRFVPLDYVAWAGTALLLALLAVLWLL